jgi:chromosome partitioning protein
MFTVSLLAQKGGVGKTTLAITLAVQAELAGLPAGVLDADPQATASGWLVAREEHLGRRRPQVASVTNPSAIRSAMEAARKEGLRWIFIDTPAGVSELPASAAAEADLILIPCVPSVFNMDAMASTVKLARHAKKPAFFLVNRGRSKGINDDCALALTTAYGLPAVNTHISQRMPIADAERTGLTLLEITSREPSAENGKGEFRALWDWLKKQSDLRLDATSLPLQICG